MRDPHVQDILRRISQYYPSPVDVMCTQVWCAVRRYGRSHPRTIHWLERIREHLDSDEDRRDIDEIIEAARDRRWTPWRCGEGVTS